MHTIWVRLNAVVFFGFSVLLALSGLAALQTTLFHEGTPVVHILQLNELKSLKRHAGIDRALLNFDIDADLRPAFNWNVKQLFVFVVAEYETETNPLNQVFIWDKIIERPEDAVIQQEKQFVKYALIDQVAELRGKEITLRLVWEQMPLTGQVFMSSGGSREFTMPLNYTTNRRS
mmetsp:Transcript_19417/g.58693  ORF Transcript_19417/g.58693 Transcript_19417/m.58693 type:complete len:175 (-) Transcript_19417:111-635(-)